jgi:hypothetical protein
VISTLDANHDGVLDAVEIANASQALKSLDKNADGRLTREELRRSRPTRTASAVATPRPTRQASAEASPRPMKKRSSVGVSETEGR